jgi:hypothetical protein
MPEEKTRKLCKIHYRQAVVLPNGTGATLETLVRSALAVEVDGNKLRDLASLRRRHEDDGTLDAQATVLVFIQDVNPGARSSYLFSALVGFRPGAEQGLLDAGDGPDLDIQSFLPPDGQHFIDFMVFSLIRGNHVLLLQGANSRRRSLEEYLSWLLQKRAEVLPLDRSLVLRTKIVMPGTAREQQRITKIRIGGHGSPADRRVTLGSELPREKRGRKGFRLGRIRTVLVDVFGATATDRLVANLGEDAEVSLQVTLGFPGKAQAEQPGIPITQIEDAIRNLDEGEVALIGENGTVIGEEVRSHHSGKIELVNGLPEPESVKKLMADAYRAFIDRGLVVTETLPVGRPPS